MRVNSIIVENGILKEVANDYISYFKVPKGVTRIGNYCFEYCPNLEEVEIPEGVEQIGYRAFDECRLLKSIIIPQSMIVIENYGFANCSSLEEVIIKGKRLNFKFGVFYNCIKLKSIKVLDKDFSTKFNNFSFHNTPFQKVHYKLDITSFLKFLKEKEKIKWIGKRGISFEDIKYLLGEEYKGLKEGLNYGI